MNAEIWCCEEFLNMPVSTRCLYFKLLHKTNENGICMNPSRILKRGYNLDDFRILGQKGFIKVLQEGLEIKRYC